MALAKQFVRKLDNLWTRRTSELRAMVIPRGVGKPTAFSRQLRERLINRLLDDATKLLLRREGKKEFFEVVSQRHLRQIKGRGLMQRGRNLISWARAKFSTPIIYSFWKGKKCLYVGKAANWRRLRGYERSAYLLGASAVEIFTVGSKSQLCKAECLATHLFAPRDLKVKPARVKWGKACPICRKHDRVHRELKMLFKIK
jgi:hypothetical protein